MIKKHSKWGRRHRSMARSMLLRPASNAAVFASLCLFCVFFISFLHWEDLQSRNSRAAANQQLLAAFKEWTFCMKANHTNNPEEFWQSISDMVSKCQSIPSMQRLKMASYTNLDETKYHISPAGQEKSVIVTLGIGRDTDAEQKMKQDMPTARFYGADPIFEINAELYRKLGVFYPFAVGASIGSSNASVMSEKTGNYETRTVSHIDIVSFLTHFVNETFIDQLLLDAEGAEYDLMPFFYRNGTFDRNNITICQFNIEVHLPNEHQKKLFHEFIERLIEDERYAFFRPIVVNHCRLYMVNYRNPTCVDKYLVQFFDR